MTSPLPKAAPPPPAYEPEPVASAAPSTTAPPLPQRRLRARLLIAALGAGVLVALFPWLAGLAGGALLYVLCLPLHRALGARLSPRVSAALLVVAALLLVLVPGIWLVVSIVGQAPETLRAAQSSPILQQLATFRIGGVALGAHLARVGGELAAWGSRQAVALVGGATQMLLDLVVAMFGLYYMLVSGDTLWERVRHWLPFSPASTELLRDRAHRVAEATLWGTALTALLQGSIVGFSLWFADVSHPLFWGAVTALASILPILGSALVWLPATAYLVLAHRYGDALFVGIAGAVVASNIDNLIRPVVYKRVSDIHPMITLVGAFAGVRLFGLVGVLLGPLAISLLFELLAIYEAEYGRNG